MGGLDMYTFLIAVQRHGTNGCVNLVAQGFPFKKVLRKAEKAAKKGYVNYVVVPDRCWLTPEGLEFLRPLTEKV